MVSDRKNKKTLCGDTFPREVPVVRTRIAPLLLELLRIPQLVFSTSLSFQIETIEIVKMVSDRKNKKVLCREGIDLRDAFDQKLLAVLCQKLFRSSQNKSKEALWI